MRVSVNMDCMEIQTRLREKNIRLYRRSFDLAKCRELIKMNGLCWDPHGLEDRWYVAFDSKQGDGEEPTDEVSKYTRIV